MRNIGVIVLAAGGSSRMGRPKQLLAYAGGTLLRHAAETAIGTGFGPVVVVLGAERDACAATLSGLPVNLATNGAWPLGLGGSLRVGVEKLEETAPATDASLILLHDQPRVSAAALRQLGELLDPPRWTLAAAFYGGRCGVPAIFDRSHFEELKTLDPAAGAKELFFRHESALARLELPEALEDLDTPADYARAVGEKGGTLFSRVP